MCAKAEKLVAARIGVMDEVCMRTGVAGASGPRRRLDGVTPLLRGAATLLGLGVVDLQEFFCFSTARVTDGAILLLFLLPLLEHLATQLGRYVCLVALLKLLLLVLFFHSWRGDGYRTKLFRAPGRSVSKKMALLARATPRAPVVVARRLVGHLPGDNSRSAVVRKAGFGHLEKKREAKRREEQYVQPRFFSLFFFYFPSDYRHRHREWKKRVAMNAGSGAWVCGLLRCCWFILNKKKIFFSPGRGHRRPNRERLGGLVPRHERHRKRGRAEGGAGLV